MNNHIRGWADQWQITEEGRNYVTLHGLPTEIDIKVFKLQELLVEYRNVKTIIFQGAMELAKECITLDYSRSQFPTKAVVYVNNFIFAYTRVHYSGYWLDNDTISLDLSGHPIVSLY